MINGKSATVKMDSRKTGKQQLFTAKRKPMFGFLRSLRKLFKSSKMKKASLVLLLSPNKQTRFRYIFK